MPGHSRLDTTAKQPSTLATPRRIAALVILVLFIIFAVQNRVSTAVQFLMLDLTGPLWLALLVSFALGGAVSWLLLGRRAKA